MQNATERPDPCPQRKAAIVTAGATDHAGSVSVSPIENFDLDSTIFKTLQGGLARFVMAVRVGKDAAFKPEVEQRIDADYQRALAERPLPDIDPKLLQFMVDECDFDVEHADGSFLDHLYFCFEYCAQHWPEGSPTVMLLHSILGTGTNTFAMTADKMPTLQALLSEDDWAHISAFPSMLRLLYDQPLRQELRSKLGAWDSIRSVRMHRVIDNAELVLSRDQFFEQLNYQLMHLLDFLPVSNWAAHRTIPSFIIFRDLYDLMERQGKRAFPLNYQAPTGSATLTDEQTSFGGWLTTKIPEGISESMTSKSIRRWSAAAGHDLAYTIDWG
jgi:hypothetical protein